MANNEWNFYKEKEKPTLDHLLKGDISEKECISIPEKGLLVFRKKGDKRTIEQIKKKYLNLEKFNKKYKKKMRKVMKRKEHFFLERVEIFDVAENCQILDDESIELDLSLNQKVQPLEKIREKLKKLLNK